MALALSTFFMFLATADAATDGQPGCKCLGAISPKVDRIDCDYPWVATTPKKCVVVDDEYGDITWFNHHPADYGSLCGAWPEPKYSKCFNTTKDEEAGKLYPTRLLNPTATWCDDPWCYIDPCKCDAPDVGESVAFKSHNLGEMMYSYSTCGASDSYTASQTSNTVGGEKCESDTAGASEMHYFGGAVIMMIGIFLV